MPPPTSAPPPCCHQQATAGEGTIVAVVADAARSAVEAAFAELQPALLQVLRRARGLSSSASGVCSSLAQSTQTRGRCPQLLVVGSKKRSSTLSRSTRNGRS